jgi:solute:Na+ symporter, SSS family
VTADYNWIYIIVNLLLYIMAYSSVNWALIQRYYCVPKEKDAYKVGWLVIVLQFIAPPLILLPAMAARQFLPELLGTPDERAVFPLVCLNLLPVGIVGLVVAAMFSATLVHAQRRL